MVSTWALQTVDQGYDRPDILAHILTFTWIVSYSLRGGVKIEKRENLGQCPNFNLGILKTEGGSLFFKNVPISII